jgi:hypothetical protein
VSFGSPLAEFRVFVATDRTKLGYQMDAGRDVPADEEAEAVTDSRSALAKRRIQWSSVYLGAVAVVGGLAAIEAPRVLAAVALDTTLGKFLYFGSLVALTILGTRAQRRETAERDAAADKRHQEERAASERRHAEVRAALARVEGESQKLLSYVGTIAAQTARGVPPDSPQMREAVESARTSAAAIRHFVMEAEPGFYKLTGYPTGGAVAESKAPISMPSVPSSSAHRP